MPTHRKLRDEWGTQNCSGFCMSGPPARMNKSELIDKLSKG